ncbi:hypothetical protein [Roseicyclus amphidinii]|uniref:hypothetical protein n=1 Tax=Roseicyclus amphidinii TaxID=3034232 RepID=UPI0024E11061|nr:hypothetical protein [Roseicyclus sp. Amp-Y-6]
MEHSPTDQHLKEIAETLKRVMDMILPLHQLLEAQEGLDTGVSQRLEDILENLAAIAKSMKSSSDALAALTESADRTQMEADIRTLIKLQENQARQISLLNGRMELMMNWLGADHQSEVGPKS